MRNKIDRETEKDEAEQLLEEQFLKESAEIEAGLSASARKRNIEASFAESLEKRKEGYDRLIAKLRETGKYREENTREFWYARIEKIREEFMINRVNSAKEYACAKTGAAAAMVILTLLMVGMLLYTDLEKIMSIFRIF